MESFDVKSALVWFSAMVFLLQCCNIIEKEITIFVFRLFDSLFLRKTINKKHDSIRMKETQKWIKNKRI